MIYDFVNAFLQHIRSKPTALERFLKPTSSLDGFVANNAHLLTNISENLLHNSCGISNTCAQELTPATGHSAFQQFVTSICAFVYDIANGVGNLGPEFLCLLKVTENILPTLSPARLNGFLESVNELRESLNLCRSVISGRAQLQNSFCLILSVTFGEQLLFVKVTGEFCQSIKQNFGSEPTLLQSFTERTVLCNHLVNGNTIDSSSFEQGVLKYLTTHSSSNDRVPIHQSYSSRCQSLTKLIHCITCLLTGRTRNSSQVCNTLNGLN